MTCEQFREQLHFMLNNKSAISLLSEMSNHKQTCKSCDSYMSSILFIHEQLCQIPHVKPSENLIKKLIAIENSAMKTPALPNWKYDVKRTLILLSPILFFILSEHIPGYVGIILNFGILTAGLALLLSTLIKPLYFTQY